MKANHSEFNIKKSQKEEIVVFRIPRTANFLVVEREAVRCVADCKYLDKILQDMLSGSEKVNRISESRT